VTGGGLGPVERKLSAIGESLKLMRTNHARFKGEADAVRTLLGELNGLGFAPSRMPSTRILTAEIIRVADEQERRISSLINGISEMR
jgi:hypothetical protein